MKTICLLLVLLFSITVFAQTNKRLLHGTTFGTKPDTTAMVAAAKLEAFMAQKIRITIAIRGKVIKVTKQKGGWFDLDAGNGKVIAAHFKNYDINIPPALKDCTVIAAGVAQKQFIADDQQHFAGDTVKGKKQHDVKVNPKHRLIFEATGLMVE
jgi:plasmid maintenance system killer protein